MATYKDQGYALDVIYGRPFETRQDCDLSGTFRNWLARRGVVPP